MTGRGYYALAALLVLATVPMYRYMYVASRPKLDLSAPAVMVRRVPVSVPVPVVEPLRRVPLLPGERCYGGVVILVNGQTYTQVSDVAGPVRCSGRVAWRRR